MTSLVCVRPKKSQPGHFRSVEGCLMCGLLVFQTPSSGKISCCRARGPCDDSEARSQRHIGPELDHRLTMTLRRRRSPAPRGIDGRSAITPRSLRIFQRSSFSPARHRPAKPPQTDGDAQSPQKPCPSEGSEGGRQSRRDLSGLKLQSRFKDSPCQLP